MSHHKIQIDHVSYTYLGGSRALDTVSFSASHGEAIGIIGANGAGKSTLLKMLTGILSPDEGLITIGQLPVTKKTLPSIRKEIGFTFQDADHQLFMHTVYEDVAFGPMNEGLVGNVLHEVVMTALETVGISHLKDRLNHTLSGGEKRAVSIAAVLAMDPSILLMDEPAVGLDPKSRLRLIRFLRSYKHTKILVSHDLDMILDVCDRVLLFSQGRLRVDGEAKNVLKDHELLESYGLASPIRYQLPIE